MALQSLFPDGSAGGWGNEGWDGIHHPILCRRLRSHSFDFGEPQIIYQYLKRLGFINACQTSAQGYFIAK